VAVYSTHPTAPLALLARTTELKAAEFKGLEDKREVVRIVAMRGSAFMLPTTAAATILSATRTPQEKLGSVLRARGLDLETYRRLAPSVLECCSTPLTRSQLRARLPVPEDAYMVARVLTREGQMLRVGGGLRTDQVKYVAAAAWLGQPFEDIDRAVALAWLARQYLRAFGPARTADFAWWSGCSRREANTALAQVHPEERDGMLLLGEDADAFEHLEPLDPEYVAVLPKWDSYTMGYAPDGRARFIEDRFLSRAYTSVTGSPGATSGDGLPLVLLGGRACATWSHRFDGNRLAVSVAPFEDSPTPRIGEITFQEVATLLGASVLDVTIVPVSH
jgi:winged helix DNA-binding protein